MPNRPNRHRDAGVVLAYIRPANVPGKFCDDLAGLIRYDMWTNKYLGPPGGTISMQSSPRIAEARSQVIDAFLTNPLYKDADWLFWLDADASFESDTLARLMDSAHATEKPIVGALAFGGANPDNMFPTIYSLLPAEGGWDMDRVLDYPRDSLVKVGATGCHCVLIHRQVFMAMAAKFRTLPNGLTNPYPWYREGTINPRTSAPIGEDVYFCIQAQMIDIPVWVDTSVKTGHCKEIVLTEDLWDRLQPVKPKLELVEDSA